MSIEGCDIYESVLNLTTHCEVNIMGTDIRTPCIPLCIGALTYALQYCSEIYGQSELLIKIIHLLNICTNPMVKEKVIQMINN